MPDWFLLAILAMTVAFVFIKTQNAAKVKRKKASIKTETREQKIRRMERELRELRRHR